MDLQKCEAYLKTLVPAGRKGKVDALLAQVQLLANGGEDCKDIPAGPEEDRDLEEEDLKGLAATLGMDDMGKLKREVNDSLRQCLAKRRKTSG